MSPGLVLSNCRTRTWSQRMKTNQLRKVLLQNLAKKKIRKLN